MEKRELLTKRRIFMRFLQYHGLREEFVKEFKNDNISYPEPLIITKFTDINKCDQFIIGAFNFGTSKLGLDKWFEIHLKWKEICKQIFKYDYER